MKVPELAIMLGAFGAIGIAYAVIQFRTGKSLWIGHLISREDSGRLYWSNVGNAAILGILAMGFAIWATVAANPPAPDPSVPVVQGEDLVVRGGRSAR